MNFVFIAFVNNEDGVAVIEYNRFKQLLDEHFEDVELGFRHEKVERAI